MKKLIILFLILGILLSSLVYADPADCITKPVVDCNKDIYGNYIADCEENGVCNPPPHGCKKKQYTLTYDGEYTCQCKCEYERICESVEGRHCLKTVPSPQGPRCPDGTKEAKDDQGNPIPCKYGSGQKCCEPLLPPPPTPEFSTYGIIAGIVVIALIAFGIYTKRRNN